MIKPILTSALILTLSACSTAQNEVVSAKDQVAGAAKMCAENAQAMQQRQAEKSLYLRLGERAGIEKFSNNLYASHKANRKLDHMFGNVAKQPFVDNVTNFVVVNSGGGGEYAGRTMPEVHKNLGITHEDFLLAGGDIQSVMKDLGHGENEIQEMVCFLVSLVPQVVTR